MASAAGRRSVASSSTAWRLRRARVAGGVGGRHSCRATDVSGGDGGAADCPETGCVNGRPCGNAGCTDYTTGGVCDFAAVLRDAVPNPAPSAGRGPMPGDAAELTYNAPTNRGVCNFCDDNPTLPRDTANGGDGAPGGDGGPGEPEGGGCGCRSAGGPTPSAAWLALAPLALLSRARRRRSRRPPARPRTRDPRAG